MVVLDDTYRPLILLSKEDFYKKQLHQCLSNLNKKKHFNCTWLLCQGPPVTTPLLSKYLQTRPGKPPEHLSTKGRRIELINFDNVYNYAQGHHMT